MCVEGRSELAGEAVLCGASSKYLKRKEEKKRGKMEIDNK